MLTLPAEISNNKDLVSIKPILLIELFTLGVYLGSKQYTLDYGGGTTHTYQDVLKFGNPFSFQQNIPELVNGLSSIGGLTVNILDYRATYRSSIIGSAPDLTGSVANVYLKFDTATTLKTNSVQIFTGYISQYSIKNDVLTLNLKTDFPGLGLIPSTLLYDGADYARPLQYGNFNWGEDYLMWGDKDWKLAACPLVIWDDDEFVARYYIADHAMENLPASISTSINSAKAFVVRDGIFCPVLFPSAATFTNAAGGSYVDTVFSAGVPTTGVRCDMFRPPTHTHASNGANYPTRAYDGKISTFAVVDATYTPLAIDQMKFSELKDSEAYGAQAYARIYFGNITGTNSHRVRITDGTNTADTTIGSGYSNAWASFPFPLSSNTLTELDDYRIEVQDLGVGGDAEVCNVMVAIRIQDVNKDDEILYLEAQGREYSGTWNSRKTSGALISNVADMIESILRDEYSYGDSDIDMDSFDDVYTWLTSTTSIGAAGSILTRSEGKNFLSNLCESWNLSLIYTPQKKWRLVFPLAGANNFSSSGTGTAGAEDIYTDVDTLSASEYTNHPIHIRSFQLRRSTESEVYGKLTIKYTQVDTETVNEQSTGSGREVTLDLWSLTGSITSRSNFMANYDNWLLHQKFIATFETFYNALALEIGDVINIRHADLNNSMVNSGNVNTQKWMVIDINASWRPNIYEITAIELLS